MFKKYFLASFFLLFSSPLFSQTFSLSGNIKDATDSSSMIGVNVLLSNIKDSTQKTGTISDANGYFKMDGITAGRYILKLVYLGYKTKQRPLNITDNTYLGTVAMKTETTDLKGVTVEGHQIRATQLGDTTQFHADAYKTHPDASAEDLVTKMPGVTSDNTGVKVNGETVQQVYVDGKPFFGNDPTLALKNLPAEVIDKIQIFDKLSDQATFTGFDDGNSQKTMNIQTRHNKSEGIFGKVYGGGGTEETFLAGGNLNIFEGDRRISILELSNNVNQQNFSTQDLLGVIGNNSGQNRGGGGGNFGGGGGGNGSGNSSNNFLVGQQGGITTTNSFGINYSDVWGKKIKVSGSYFFNSTNNNNNTLITRNYFTSTDTLNNYNENDNPAQAINYNHRFNLRMEYTIDSFNTIIFTPNISFQQNNTTNGTIATDSLGNYLSSQTVNHSSSNYSGYSGSGNLLIQHKFTKLRRTISLNLSPSLNEKTGNGAYYSMNNYYSSGDFTLLNQNFNSYSNSNSLSANLTYTEPVGKKGQILASYSPSISKSYSDKETHNFNDTTQSYSILDTFYSNRYNSLYNVQKGGVSYRIGDKRYNLMFGVNYQYAMLTGDQVFPYSLTIPQKDFSNILPNAFFNYRFADGRNLRIMYRTNIAAPSVTQLQDVVDISNPLLLKTGNPSLKQDYENTLIVRYGQTKSKSAHNFFVYIYLNYINDYIGNATYQPLHDSLFSGQYMAKSFIINKGSQLTLPINLNGYLNERTFVTYSIPADIIKSNLNFNGGISFVQTPGSINNKTNYSDNYAPSLGVVLSSNISEKLDFTLSYTGTYNYVKNTLETSANNNYYNHTAGFKINWIFLKSFVFNTNINNSYYTAFAGTGNQNYFLWNTYLAYKLLKKQALEIRFTCYDMLNQNKSVSRTVTETYVQNSFQQVLKQYFMLQLTYTIRNFKGTPPTDNSKNEHEQHFPGMRPWGDGSRIQ